LLTFVSSQTKPLRLKPNEYCYDSVDLYDLMSLISLRVGPTQVYPLSVKDISKQLNESQS